MKILITGFEAFDGMAENPTDLLVKEIRNGCIRISPDVDLRVVTLPVVFGDSFLLLEQQINSFNPDYVLAFGVASGREFIEFERIAINCMDAQIAD
ncbi:MAG TPA: hypothetical protein VNJ08_08870, partial [Bacteriovoracaceae bacterium]|nr:hypothetical protein [Bacteriovoracaceae bacterium]